MTPDLAPLPEDWERGLAVVAHPDDMEYGAASAVARWTAQGKHVVYVLVTDGEAGIATMPPERAGPVRREEQRAACAAVGVNEVDFLGYPDGQVIEGLALRADLAAALRRHRPDVVLSINHRDSWGGPSWNHADHRAVGRSLLDAARDAATGWLFPERGDPWSGVRFVAFNGSPHPTHAVDVTGTIDAGTASLRCHRAYLDAIGQDQPDQFLRCAAEAGGRRLGVPLATTFEVVDV
ncbi:MAG: PIG-L deacetylase family protein [Acidimicrobiia bacterium]